MGDRFYLNENKILCEYDYEEMLAFANMSVQTPASLAYIKRQLPPTPTPPGQNMHPGHNPQQPHQGLGQAVGQHNHASNVSYERRLRGVSSPRKTVRCIPVLDIDDGSACHAVIETVRCLRSPPAIIVPAFPIAERAVF